MESIGLAPLTCNCWAATRMGIARRSDPPMSWALVALAALSFTHASLQFFLRKVGSLIKDLIADANLVYIPQQGGSSQIFGAFSVQPEGFGDPYGVGRNPE